MAADSDEISSLRADLEKSAEIEDVTEQMLEVAAIVGEAVASLGIHPIVVGGLAIAYWAPGAYLTGDIDVVMPRLEGLDARLAQLGFNREGRFWTLPERKIFFESPGSELELSPTGYRTVELASGRSVRVQAAEEVLLFRLKEFVAQGHAEVFQQCLWLLGSSGIDHSRLGQRAKEERLESALKVLAEQAKEVRAGHQVPESWELKRISQTFG